jgi:uncharacterized protein (TIGR02271 family)
MKPSDASASLGADTAITVPVHEERLRVETQEIDTGRGVRIHKHVAERPETVRQELWHEQIDVERVAVNSIVAELPQVRHEDDTMIVPVVEEVLVVEKRYRIKEEVRIRRRREAEVHEATLPLKSEELTIERFDSPTQPDNP